MTILPNVASKSAPSSPPCHPPQCHPPSPSTSTYTLLHLQKSLQRHLKTAQTQLQHEFDQYNKRFTAVGPLTSDAVLKTTLTLVTSVCLTLGHPSTATAANFSSITEDKLLETTRSARAKFGGALEQLRSVVPGGQKSSDTSTSSEERVEKARALVQEVWEVVNANFSDVRAAGYSTEKWQALLDSALKRPLRDQSAAQSAVREMLAELRDPYTRYLTPVEFSAMAKYDVSGVGLNLGTAVDFESKTGLLLPNNDNKTYNVADDDTMDSNNRKIKKDISTKASGGGQDSRREGGIFVVGLIQGSLADAAGIRQGDELLTADGVPLSGQSPFQVASLLQGQLDDDASDKGGSGIQQAAAAAPLKITVRTIQGDTKEVELQRPPPRVDRSPVSFKLEKSEGSSSSSSGEMTNQPVAVGYIKLRSFDARAQRDVAAAVRKLQSEGAQRLVLDLRGNRGGLVTEGVEVAKLFLSEGDTVVRTQSKARPAATISNEKPLTTAPLAVLVDGGTASASEIAAGALKDNCRAVLVGGRTYGKGLIQSVYELSDGSGLVLTVGKYMTPAGTDIDREGIVPEFRSMPSGDVADEAIAACKTFSDKTTDLNNDVCAKKKEGNLTPLEWRGSGCGS